MNIYKLCSLLFIIGLCTYAVLLTLQPHSDSNNAKTTEPTKTQASSSAQTRLFFSPSTRVVSQNLPIDIPIMIDTGSNPIIMAQLELEYDPTVITVLDIRAGSVIENPLIPIKEINQINGRIQFVVESDPEVQTNPFKGSGTIATVSIIPNPLASQSAISSLKFLKKTAVRGNSQTHTVLQSTEDLILQTGTGTL